MVYALIDLRNSAIKCSKLCSETMENRGRFLNMSYFFNPFLNEHKLPRMLEAFFSPLGYLLIFPESFRDFRFYPTKIVLSSVHN